MMPRSDTPRSLHIAVAGPMTLSMLEPELGAAAGSAGFPFPGTAQLVLEYLSRGHRVTAVTTGFDIQQIQRVSSPRLELVVVPSRGRGRGRAFDFFRAERAAIRGALDDARADVVHAHWTYEFGLAARRSRAPSLVTVHDWAPQIARHNRHPYWYFRWAMQVACLVRRGALSAPSAYVAERVQRLYRQECPVIPNGVVLQPFQQVEARPERPTVVMLNNGFTNLKNVATALRAWPAVRRAVPTALLVLGGPDFEPTGIAAEWAGANGLDDGVRFDGPVASPDVPGWLSQASLFLHASRQESFGMVLVEAMAAGLPIIAGRNSGGATEVAAPAGLLVDVDDPAEVAAALIDLLSDDARRARMTAEGRSVAARFSVDETTTAFLDRLTDLAGTSSSRTALRRS